MPRAISPGPVGLKFWKAPGLSADNTDDTGSLPAGIGNQFNPWGPKRPVQDWVWGNLCLYPPPSGADTTNLPAGAANWFNPWGPRRGNPYWTWFSALHIPVPVTFTAAGGSYTLTGSSAAQAFGQAAASGSYTLTGSAAALAFGHAAGSGSYTLTGSSAALAFGQVVGAGSYTITGTDAGLVIPGGIAAAAGSYTLTGSDAALTVSGGADYLPAGMTGGYNPWRRPFPINLRTITGRGLAAPAPVILPAAAGSYTLTGSDAALTVSGVTVNMPAGMTGGYAPWGRPPRQDWFWSVAYTTAPSGTTLSAEAGSYALSGSAAGLTATTVQYIVRPPLITRIWARSRTVAVGAQSWVLRHQFVGSIRLSADAGGYVVTGSSAALAFRLTANAGSYTLTGSAAAPLIALPAAAGSYTLTGSTAGWALVLTASAGSYTLTGDATTPITAFPAAAGSYVLTGSDVAFIGGTAGNNYVLTCNVGSYAITGSDATLPLGLSAGSGSYALTGSAAGLTVGNVFLGADAGSYTITGSDAALALGLSVNSGAYALTGGAAPLALGLGAAAGSYAYSGADAQLHQAGTIILVCEAGSYTLTGGDVSFLGVIPPTVEQPGGGYTGGRVEYRKYRLRKKRLRDECEELLEYLEGLPPAQAREICEQIPLERLSLLELLPRPLPLPHGIVIPQGPRRPLPQIEDDEDEDEIALLLEILNRS